MLHHITGSILHIYDHSIVISSGPIGFEIMVPRPASFTQSKQATLYIYMHWNAEQGPSWYGFDSLQDKAAFLLIISCNGIGPKIGLAVLNQIGASGFVNAIQQSDDRSLSKVSGIGSKKAEQIIVQLKHKVSDLIKDGIVSFEISQAARDWHTITQALEALNYSRGEITSAINHLRSLDSKEQMSFDHLMRKALTYLSKQ